MLAPQPPPPQAQVWIIEHINFGPSFIVKEKTCQLFKVAHIIPQF